MENKKYSLLLIALYCHFKHVKDLIEHLRKKNPLVEITLLSDTQPEEVRKVIPDTAIKIEWYDVSSANNIRWRWLRFMVIKHRQIDFFSRFSKNKKYDIINIHFANRYMSYVYDYLRLMSDNLVLTPWGSDILRRDSLALSQLKKIYECCDYIATSPKSIIGKTIIEKMNIPPKKFVGGFFGSDIVDYALKYGDSVSQEESKLRFGLNDRYVITCGYNLNRAQRHVEIIEAIGNIKDQLPSNLSLLFPMTYGEDLPNYVQMCKEKCEEKGLHAVFITEYLNIENLFKLRMATDMFVHVQTTDSAARSVCEYILCNKKIVHGSWMKYDFLEVFKPLFYFPVDRMENLEDSIVNAYKSVKIDIPQGVKDYVKKRSWNYRISLLNDFYMSLLLERST